MTAESAAVRGANEHHPGWSRTLGRPSPAAVGKERTYSSDRSPATREYSQLLGSSSHRSIQLRKACVNLNGPDSFLVSPAQDIGGRESAM